MIITKYSLMFQLIIPRVFVTPDGNNIVQCISRSFIVGGRAQNMSFISFENIDDLTLDIDDIDYGDKQFVFR